MIAHYTRVAIEHAQIINTFSDCDLKLRFIEGAKPPYLELSLDGRCVEKRLLPDLNAVSVQDLIGKQIWIAIINEPGEQIGCRGWEYIRPYKEGDNILDIQRLPFPKPTSNWELLARISQNLRNRGPQPPLH
jgi:hypothetical protein